ncbi:hypothetical protein ACOJR9_13500 [Alteromonas sp. A081]|uniref:hypothetical protein n=1 Tax=Alteromonas sp. A081 TaxID=3410269 RepID=UPI003B97EE01
MLIRNIRQKINTIFYNQVAANVLQTSPVDLASNSDTVVVSQLYHNALYMSIVALKTFILNFGKCDLHIINDGSLTESDLNLLKAHFPNCTIVNFSDINMNGCPSGGCWERLCYILSINREKYVIQVDTDTLTTNAIQEVIEAARSNIAFTIGDPNFMQPMSLESLRKFAESKNSLLIQHIAEAQLIKIKGLSLNSYIRGCAAFTGFPQGTDLITRVKTLSTQMENILGDRWLEWGSEQFASNVMISSCQDSFVLPWPKYQNYGYPPHKGSEEEVAVYHFIGSNRHSDSHITKKTKEWLAIHSN